MEKLTVSSSAVRLDISREAINKLIRPHKKKPGWENSKFFITIKDKKLMVNFIDGTPFILFKENVEKSFERHTAA